MDCRIFAVMLLFYGTLNNLPDTEHNYRNSTFASGLARIAVGKYYPGTYYRDKAANGAKEALRGGGDIITIPENNSEVYQPKVMALVIIEDIEDEDEDESEEANPSMKYESPMLPWIENPQIMLPWIENVKSKDFDEDSSGESNSDEYPDSDAKSGTDSESNYYHEDDYLKDQIKKEIKLLDVEKHYLEPLRKNRWRACQKTVSKYCRKACEASYKNACKEQKCKRKFIKIFKKQCKKNCNEFFE